VDCGVYQIRNTVNDKRYIGSTKHLSGRRKEHFRKLEQNNHENRHLQRSFNKYGKENFQFSVIVKCDKIRLEEYEQYWMDRLDICNDEEGYNIRPKADFSEHSQETKDRLSKCFSGIAPFEGEDHWNYGNKTPKKVKAKISKSVSGKNNPFYGKSHSEETKEKLSKQKQGENNKNSKLTAIQVVALRELYKHTNATQKAISEVFNINSSTIGSIMAGNRWGHLTPN
jgi:group I intron endonuclease